jgi:hypothetical protein
MEMEPFPCGSNDCGLRHAPCTQQLFADRVLLSTKGFLAIFVSSEF